MVHDEHNDLGGTVSTRRQVLTALAIAGTLVALLATLLAIDVAYLTVRDVCGPNCHEPLAYVQMVLAVAGVLPVATLVFASCTGRWRLAAIALIMSIVVYLLWGLFNDAVVHGWGDLIGAASAYGGFVGGPGDA